MDDDDGDEDEPAPVPPAPAAVPKPKPKPTDPPKKSALFGESDSEDEAPASAAPAPDPKPKPKPKPKPARQSLFGDDESDEVCVTMRDDVRGGLYQGLGTRPFRKGSGGLPKRHTTPCLMPLLAPQPPATAPPTASNCP